MKKLFTIVISILLITACKPTPTPEPTLGPVTVDRWYLTGHASKFCESAIDLVDHGKEYFFDMGEGEGIRLKVDSEKIVYVEEHVHFFPVTRGADLTGRRLPHNEGWIFSLKTPDDKILETTLIGNCDTIVTLTVKSATPTPNQ